MVRTLEHWLLRLVAGLLLLAGLFLTFKIYIAGQPLVALACLGILAAGTFVYTSGKAYAYRYLFPGVLTVLVFVVFPLAYTFSIGFTNYSSRNLLEYDRARQYFLDETYVVDGESYAFTLHADGPAFRVRLESEHGDIFVTDPLALQNAVPLTVKVKRQEAADAPLSEPADTKTLIANLKALKLLSVTLPSGQIVSASGLREFAPVRKLYLAQPDGSLKNEQDGSLIKPNMATGFFETSTGEALQPGFKVGVGWSNFTRIFTDKAFSEPFVRIFGWTVVFAGLTVLFAFSVGIVLAVLMSWEALRFRKVYSVLLFLPYAVPGFISILVFKGLFSENAGEINLILQGLFGIKPHWFTDPFLAKVMLLIVNTWLGFPYMMLLSMGLIKAIPSDLYEASAIAGAGPLTNFFKITLPLIAKPITPLLISAFAFNFNNFVLIALLTNGRPDFLDTKVPAGTTDLLVSYTYRIAFQDSGQNFGLAAAISTVVFLMVAVLSIINLRLTKVNQVEVR
ncbi:maltose ABC transporter permease MalF [Chitinimonas sp.]|uniref:maltose ABC transporter permease MalF n=1 Tax=Chitinimonas sp. TaxID=1934313 RepID=UPI002F9595CD